MTTSEFITSKDITLKELNTIFIQEKKEDIEFDAKKGCPNCGNQHNLYSKPSEAWTSVYYCVACKRINMILHSDRMGGNYIDTLLVFRAK